MLVAIILVYVMSAYGFWNYVRLSHSKDGIFSAIEPDTVDIVLVFTPILNLIFCYLYLMDPPVKREFKKPIKKKSSKRLNKFFNIKK
jgi:hypothetical protein